MGIQDFHFPVGIPQEWEQTWCNFGMGIAVRELEGMGITIMIKFLHGTTVPVMNHDKKSVQTLMQTVEKVTGCFWLSMVFLWVNFWWHIITMSAIYSGPVFNDIVIISFLLFMRV